MTEKCELFPQINTGYNTKVHSHSVNPRKLCDVHIAINHTPLSMAYYTYDHDYSQLTLGPTTLLYVYQKNSAVKRSYVHVLLEFEPVLLLLGSYGDFGNYSDGQLNANGL